mmetsp:Transcript_42249/g.107390  ORF Transcript_42249/g.107390 Transcript_42249/m.107390 type:complete len:333 (-) Transcript_42249:521-1519(-)
MPHRRGLGLLLAQLKEGIGQHCEFFGELRALGNMLVDIGGQLLHLGLLVLARELVRAELGVAIALFVRLGVCLLHQFHDHVLDHRLDLDERVGIRVRGHQRQVATAELAGAAVQEGRDALPDLGDLWALDAAELNKGRPELHQLRQMLVGAAGNLVALQDLHGLPDGLDLLGADHLVLLKLHGLRVARREGVRELLLVLRLARLRRRQVRLRDGRVLEALRLGRRLVLGALLVLLDVVLEVLCKHLVVGLGIHLRLLHSRQLVLELVAQPLENAHHTAGLVLVGVGRWRRDAVVRSHGQETVDGRLRLLGEAGHLADLEQGLWRVRLPALEH